MSDVDAALVAYTHRSDPLPAQRKSFSLPHHTGNETAHLRKAVKALGDDVEGGNQS